VPLHLQPVFAGLGQGKGSFLIAETASDRVMSLPMHPYMTEETIQRIVSVFSDSLLAQSVR
jgi:UDP-2-acetamido-2-deoxy-ribo-hexuluronate aminotransferase